MKIESVRPYQPSNTNTQTLMVCFCRIHGITETTLFSSSSCLHKRKANSNLQLEFRILHWGLVPLSSVMNLVCIALLYISPTTPNFLKWFTKKPSITVMLLALSWAHPCYSESNTIHMTRHLVNAGHILALCLDWDYKGGTSKSSSEWREE